MWYYMSIGPEEKHKTMGSGEIMMFAGAAVYNRMWLQPSIAQSSTEAEFTNMVDDMEEKQHHFIFDGF